MVIAADVNDFVLEMDASDQDNFDAATLWRTLRQSKHCYCVQGKQGP